MKRSQVNQIISQGLGFCRRMNFHLPPFALFSPADWRTRGQEWDEVRDNMLGWDVTDFGSGVFDRIGLLLFTIRNGNAAMPDKYPKPYCEKLLIVEENQVTPCHYHYSKVEDIICRGGGNLLVKVWARDEQDGLGDKPLAVTCDGHRFTVPAGEIIRLTPGESITLPSYVYHTFWAEEGRGTVLSGEVSKVNDDQTDNHFLEQLPRFSAIDQDEPPQFLLCTEYPEAS